MKGTWLLPTRGRPEALKRFFEAWCATGATTPGIIIAETWQDCDTDNWPENWRAIPSSGGCFAEAMKAGLQAYRDEHGEPDWIGYVADDNIPETPQWDTRLIDRLKGWNVINSNDGWQSRADVNVGRMHGAVVWSGELVRAVGYLFPPGLKHMFTETVWETLGRATGCWQTDMSVMVRHAHASLTGLEDDTTRHANVFYESDEATYNEWCKAEKGEAIERILSLMDEYGSKIALPDLSAYRLMIATPSGDGRYERSFVRSWYDTVSLIKDCGGKVEWIEMPYCADLALSRAKLLGTFWRSSFTHLMMIDDDMGWCPYDVVRLLQSGKDFIGGAGPMRRYPLKFCVNFPARGTLTEGSGEMEAEKVGGAFFMVTRKCVAQMIEAYRDLEFVMAENTTSEFALFDPVFVEIEGKRWRFSEDYSFCYRWRKIGGKIYIFPDIRLDHSGAHTFSGALSDIMMRPEHG